MNPATVIFLGVDGGGTKTACCAVTSDDPSTPISTFTSGCSNPNSTGHAAAKRELFSAISGTISGALSALSLPPSQVRVGGVFLGMAGVDRDADKTLMRSWVAECLPDDDPKIIVENDAVNALMSGTDGVLHGVVVIAGTGTICYGRHSETNESARARGWGCLTDSGSGYWIGRQVLKAVWDAHDGFTPPTALTQLVLDAVSLERPEQLIDWIYGDMAFHRIASLAILAFQAANTDDAAATAILHLGAKHLADGILLVSKRLNLLDSPTKVVLSGSVARNATMQKLIASHLTSHPNLSLVEPTITAELGAARHIATST